MNIQLLLLALFLHSNLSQSELTSTSGSVSSSTGSPTTSGSSTTTTTTTTTESNNNNNGGDGWFVVPGELDMCVWTKLFARFWSNIFVVQLPVFSCPGSIPALPGLQLIAHCDDKKTKSFALLQCFSCKYQFFWHRCWCSGRILMLCTLAMFSCT